MYLRSKSAKNRIVLTLVPILLAISLVVSGLVAIGCPAPAGEAPGGAGEKAMETVIQYNAPPLWADWAGQIRAIRENLGIVIPYDNKNSGMSLAALIAERKAPVASLVYYGVSFGFLAKEHGVIAPFKSKYWDEIPAELKDPDGYWFTIHKGTLGFFVNKDALGGRPVPQSWADLLDPMYRGMVGYLDPTTAFVGYVGAVAVNNALGGTFDNFDPAIEFFQKLRKNDAIVPKMIAYAKVLSGEIPILLDFDFNAYRAKHVDRANVVFVIPAEGTIVVPYVMSLVKNAPNPEAAKRVIDFILSDKGQAVWANAFLRPVRGNIPPEVAAKFLPASEYERVVSVDFAKMAEVQEAFGKRYLAEVR
ncbi:MAG: putative 2-aminoethylphosphonate-binding periplasmic protein [Syntrophomonadaceae bacterium]|nr:putative 2-aminoethylphosphonate-binding periplasmic protein [Bacillota bacterium]